MSNKQRITLVSFLAYFVMSGMLAPVGIISGPMAEFFDQSITDITGRFAWLTFGNFAGAVLALWAFDLFDLKKLMAGIYAAMLAAIVSLYFSASLTMIGFALGIVGVGCGLGLAGAALIISRTYEDERRASMLVITDGCFSIAGFVVSGLATALVVRSFHWAAAYQFVAFVSAMILLLIVVSSMPATRRRDLETIAEPKWPLSVWLCIFGLLLYTSGQWAMLWWLPNYAETRLGASKDDAGALVGQFWMGMFAAQIFVAWWVLRVGVPRLVTIAGVCTALFSMPIWLVSNVDVLWYLAFLWGFANLSLLKVVLSYATTMVDVPSPRLVSALLLGATAGTAISPLLTKTIVELTDNFRILQFSSLCYVTLAVLLIVVTRKRRVDAQTQGLY